MALRDILKDAVYDAKAPISDADFIRNYNAVVRDLAKRYEIATRVVETSFLETKGTEWYALTSGCLGVKRVVDSDGETTRYYSIRDAVEIHFDYDGDYTVFEQVPHAKVTAMTATATLNGQFDEAVAKYIASKCAKVDADKLYADYLAEAEMANNMIRRNRNRNARVGTTPYI
jgi:hypothetical protein